MIKQIKINQQIRSSKKMDSCRHRGRSQFSEKSLNLLATTSMFPIIKQGDSQSAEMVSMEKIVVHKKRRSRSLSLKRNNNSSKSTCQTDHTAPFMLNRQVSNI